MKRVGDLATRAISLRVSLRQTPQNQGDAVACKERTESMPRRYKRRVIWFAASLLARPMKLTASLHTEPATVRVYERLRRHSAQPWELTIFRRSLPVLWLLPSRNLPAQCGSANANGGLRGLGEVDSNGRGRGWRGRNHSDCAAARLFLPSLARQQTLRLDRRFTP